MLLVKSKKEKETLHLYFEVRNIPPKEQSSPGSKASDYHIIGSLYGVNGKKLQCQYKDYLSDFKEWKEKKHARQWLVFPENIGPYLSIDETALSRGELYTIITNKKARGKKGALVAIMVGTKV